MSATAITSDVQHRRQPMSTAFPLGAVLTTAGSLGYIATNSLPPREASLHPVGLAGSAVALLGCVILSLALVQWRPRLPRWAVVTSAVGVWFAGAIAWSFVTIVPVAAAGTTNEQFDDLFFGNTWALWSMLIKSTLCLVGFLGLAIAGWRSRSIPHAAAAVFALAALASIWPPFPPGLILASLALVLVARSESKTGG